MIRLNPINRNNFFLYRVLGKLCRGSEGTSQAHNFPVISTITRSIYGSCQEPLLQMHFIQLNAAAALIQINVYLMYEFRSGINRMQWQPHKIPRANEFMVL